MSTHEEEEIRVSSGTSSSYGSNPEHPTVIQLEKNSPVSPTSTTNKQMAPEPILVEMLNDYYVRRHCLNQISSTCSKLDYTSLVDLFKVDDEDDDEFHSKLIANRIERSKKLSLVKQPEFSYLDVQIKSMCEDELETAAKINQDFKNFVKK